MIYQIDKQMKHIIEKAKTKDKQKQQMVLLLASDAEYHEQLIITNMALLPSC